MVLNHDDQLGYKDMSLPLHTKYKIIYVTMKAKKGPPPFLLSFWEFFGSLLDCLSASYRVFFTVFAFFFIVFYSHFTVCNRVKFNFWSVRNKIILIMWMKIIWKQVHSSHKIYFSNKIIIPWVSLRLTQIFLKFRVSLRCTEFFQKRSLFQVSPGCSNPVTTTFWQDPSMNHACSFFSYGVFHEL